MTDTRINGNSLTTPDIIVPEFGCSAFLYKDVGLATGQFPDNSYSLGELETFEDKFRTALKSFFSSYPVLSIFKGTNFHFYLHNFAGSGKLTIGSNANLQVTIPGGVIGGERGRYHPFATANIQAGNLFDDFGRSYSTSSNVGIAIYNTTIDDGYFNYIVVRQILARMVLQLKLFDSSSSELSKTLSRVIVESRILLSLNNTSFGMTIDNTQPEFLQLFNELFQYCAQSGDPNYFYDPVCGNGVYASTVLWKNQMRQLTERSWFGARRFCEDVIFLLGGKQMKTLLSNQVPTKSDPRILTSSAVLNTNLTANHTRRYQMILLLVPIVYSLLQNKKFYDLSGIPLDGLNKLSFAPISNDTIADVDWTEDLSGGSVKIQDLMNTFPIPTVSNLDPADWIGWSFEDNNSYTVSATSSGKRFQLLTFGSVATETEQTYHSEKSLVLYEFKQFGTVRKWTKVASFLPENMFIDDQNTDSIFQGVFP